MTGAQIRDWQDWAERRKDRERKDGLRVAIGETRDAWRLAAIRGLLAGKEAA